MRTLADGRPALRPPPPLHELRARREEIVAIAAGHGASNIRIFGSVARGEANRESDLDLLIEMEEGRSLFDMGGLLMDLEELLGCPVDVAESDALGDRTKKQVLAEAVPL